MADLSEFQVGANLSIYRASHDALILRAHNGHRPDYCWAEWQAAARALNFVALGFYQYVVASRTTISQAQDMIATVGKLRDNEFVVCDSEEGSGSQIIRVQEWFRIIDEHYGRPASLYASESWYGDQLGGAARWRDRPRWVAAYRTAEPSLPHEWWQYSSSSRFPGISGSVDASVFHGTSREFAAVVCGHPAAPPAAPPETVSMAVAAMPDGRQEVFAELASGEVQHRWNSVEGGWVEGWHSLGKPGG